MLLFRILYRCDALSDRTGLFMRFCFLLKILMFSSPPSAVCIRGGCSVQAATDLRGCADRGGSLLP